MFKKNNQMGSHFLQTSLGLSDLGHAQAPCLSRKCSRQHQKVLTLTLTEQTPLFFTLFLIAHGCTGTLKNDG